MSPSLEPCYLALLRSGELRRRAEQARALLSPCRLCPRECGADRLAGETGFCRVGARARVASLGPHFGEETPLVGSGGSGTIFFSGCNLACLFCQNYDISQLDQGREVSAEALAAFMVDLQEYGCHNINFVTPTHVVPQILEALEIAAGQGLHLPLVYNCGGYEHLDTLRLLDGIIDIYMPDAKYDDPQVAERLSSAPDYPAVNRAALREMHRQVGDLTLNEAGLAVRGLLVRHLLLPEGLAGTEGIMRFLAELSPDTYVNVMPQYRPCFRAAQVPALQRRITAQEYAEAVRLARAAGLHRLDERRL